MPCSLCGRDGETDSLGLCSECAAAGVSMPPMMFGLEIAQRSPGFFSVRDTPSGAPAAATTAVLAEFGQDEQVRLRNPFSVGTDDRQNILVLDMPSENTYRVVRFSPQGDFAGIVMECREGDGPEQLRFPKGLAIGAQGNIFIPDAGNDRIQVFGPDGRHLDSLGGPGDGPGEFSYPCDVETDEGGAIYVADTENSRIQKLTPQGVVLLIFGDRPDEFALTAPTGVTVDRNGRVFVADTENDRVVVFDAEGEPLLAFGGAGGGLGEFNGPSDVRVTDEGTIFVADNNNNRVQIFTPDGKAVAEFSLDIDNDPVDGGDIAIDEDGHVLICNAGRHTIVRVELLRGPGSGPQEATP